MSWKPDLGEPGFAVDPYPTYRRMRAECPAHREVSPDWMNPMRNSPVWYITRFEDAKAILSDTERFVKEYRLAYDPRQLAELPPMTLFWQLASESMVNREAPDHPRLRSLVNKAFTPRMVESLGARVQAIADGLIDEILAKKGEPVLDLVPEYSFVLPLAVITDMLGVPEADQASFRGWSTVLVAPPRNAEELALAERTTREFMEYLQALFARRRNQPGDDLLTGLLSAEQDGDRLSERELISMVILLLVAGNETTAGLITAGVYNLLKHPDARAALERDPSLYGNAVEELLRYDSSVDTSTARWAAVDVELHGQTIKRGDRVILALGSANRDEQRFAEPDTLDIHRADRRHLAFGHGPHICLGAPVARLEARIALETLFRRLPGLRLAVPESELTWISRVPLRVLKELPVTWD